MAVIPGDTNTNFATLNGDASRFLNTKDYGGINSALGYDPNRRNYNFISNGNIYRVGGAGDEADQGIYQIDTVGNRTAAQQKAETDALNAKQKSAQDEFLNRFRTAVGAQEKLPDMASRIGASLGLPDLQKSAQGLIKSVSQIPEVQTNATRGYNVNSNQLARIIGARQAELAPAAQQAVTQEQAAESNLATQLGYGVAQQQKDLAPFTTEQSMLSDQLAREYSGFTQDKQNQLQLIMQSISNGQQLTMQQLQNANAMAVAKLGYDSQMEQLNKQLASAGTKNGYLTLGEGQTVYDPVTGQVKYTAPKTYAPNSSSMGSWS